jgi:hypothetical protein
MKWKGLRRKRSWFNPDESGGTGKNHEKPTSDGRCPG